MTRPLTLMSIAATVAMIAGLTAAPAHAASCGVQEYQDGTFGPAVCRNGDANTAVQARYEKVAPAIMALPASPTRVQIRKAICADRKADATGVTLYDAIAYQSARYDWSRGLAHEANRRIVAGRYC